MSGSFSPYDRCLLDGHPATVLAVLGIWAWVAKDRDQMNPETVYLTLLDPLSGGDE